MTKRLAALALFAAIGLAGCEEEAAPATDTSATGGEAAGEVLGGTISDDMIPLEQLTSTSPPAERRTTTTTTVTRSATAQETTVETMTTSGDAASQEQAPTPPEPPATPDS